MSYALLRRFAIIDIPNPPPAITKEIIAEKGSSGDLDLDGAIGSLVNLPYRPVSPAILIDCGRFLSARAAVSAEAGLAPEPSELLQEALFAYVVPQLDDLSKPQLQDIVTFLQENVLKSMTPNEVARLLSSALQVNEKDIRPSKSGQSVEDALIEEGLSSGAGSLESQ
jgi:hypothetical protein